MGSDKKSLQLLGGTPEQKRDALMKLVSDYPVTLICGVLDYPRSSYYYRPQRPAADEAALASALQTVAGEWPTDGYRRLTARLRREGRLVNSKRVRRLMQQLGLQSRVRPKRRRTTDSEHPFARYANLVQGLEIVRPDQVWVADLTYVRLLHEFVYLAVLMDAFSRRCIGWALERYLDTGLTLAALRMALAARTVRPGLVHHSDQGVQYAAGEYTNLLGQQGIRISMGRRGNPYDNAQAESFLKTLKYEEVYVYEYEDLAEARRRIGHFLEVVYNEKRLHSALGYVPPAEFERSQAQPQVA